MACKGHFAEESKKNVGEQISGKKLQKFKIHFRNLQEKKSRKFYDLQKL